MGGTKASSTASTDSASRAPRGKHHATHCGVFEERDYTYVEDHFLNKYFAALVTGLRQCPVYEGVMYRGATAPLGKQLNPLNTYHDTRLVGHTIETEQVLSFSMNELMIYQWLAPEAGREKYVYKILSTAASTYSRGYVTQPLSMFPGEREATVIDDIL